MTSADDATVELVPTKVSALPTTSSSASKAPDGQFILKSGTISSNEDTTYRLRMWVADDYAGAGGSITSQNYKLRVNVYGAAAAQ